MSLKAVNIEYSTETSKLGWSFGCGVVVVIVRKYGFGGGGGGWKEVEKEVLESD